MWSVGFTGTSKGMTPRQKALVGEALARYWALGARTFRHGLCIGADEEAAAIAKELGYRIVAYPGYSPRNPGNRLYRSEFNGNDEIREEKPFLKRDHDIVDESDRMVAAPLTREEQLRSGTWTTVRYARKKKKPIEVAYP